MRIRQWDGIRALAILLVLGEHTLDLRMGWAGVDLFFVLSGLLITRILRQDRGLPRYWGRFYLKRAARILPPLVVLFVVCAFFPMYPRKLWLGFVFFVGNFVRTAYAHVDNPIFITWSLAIEEQFYLLWPLAVRFLSRKQLLRLLTAVLVAEPIVRAIATPFTRLWHPMVAASFIHPYQIIYYLTPFRIDGLALGSLLALLLENEQTKERIRQWTTPALIVSAVLVLVPTALFPAFRRPANSIIFNSLGYTLVAVASASLICFTLLREDSWLTKIFLWRPLILLGTISYGVYLFHGLFIRALENKSHLLLSSLLAVGATFLYCWLSFKFYEQPFTRWAHRTVKGWAPARQEQGSEVIAA
jgi:peptidoglycan/LPS O-acetylase OafA/YrhL